MGGVGEPLSTSVRSYFHSRFGQDVGHGVRVHRDPRAGGVARALGARAFTHGDDVYFGHGAYRPESRRGLALIGHELVHVAQQRLAGPSDRPLVMRWEGREHKILGNRAQNRFPRRGTIDTHLTALRLTPRRRTDDPHRNTLADLHRGVEVMALANVGRWIRVLVLSGEAINRRGQVIDASGLTGYVSEELITDSGETFDAELTVGPGITLSYGDLVAMGGDHFESLDQIEAEAATPQGRSRIARLQALIDSESGVGEAYRAPSFEDPALISEDYATRYRDMALENVPHFLHGGTAIRTWTGMHASAISDAFEAGTGARLPMLERAMALNAFADHFLTDSFSSGHVRVPRQAMLGFYASFSSRVFDRMLAHISERLGARIYEQLRQDYRRVRLFGSDEDRQEAIDDVRTTLDETLEEKGGAAEAQRLFGVALAGLFAKILHDIDNARGLRVSSPERPSGWTAYGDKYLLAPENAENLDIALEAVRASKADVLTAFNTGLDLYARHGDAVTNEHKSAALPLLRERAGPPYRALGFVPGAAPGTADPGGWRWGELSDEVRRHVVQLVHHYLTAEAREALLSQIDPPTREIEVRGPNVIARPRDAAAFVLDEFVNDPIRFLEAAFGQSAQRAP